MTFILQQQIQATLKRYKMLETGERVLLGVSGGMDSVVLLDSLAKLRPKTWDCAVCGAFESWLARRGIG